MKELSIFIDESGDAGEVSHYYLITLLFHDQDETIDEALKPYEADLVNRSLSPIPMHLGPLLNGNDAYKGLDISIRKKYLSSFRIMASHLAFSYKTLTYEKKRFSNDKLLNIMRRDLTDLLFNNIEWLQSFDVVKVYYDDGQQIVTKAIHNAIEYVLAKNAIIYRDAKPSDYVFLQVADYICTLELTAVKFQDHNATKTDETFFGQWGAFKRNFLKKLRKHRLE